MYPDPITDCKNSYFTFLSFTQAHVIKTFNHDVKFRLAEIALVCDLDYLIRHHLAKDDRSHNEVEHIQS